MFSMTQTQQTTQLHCLQVWGGSESADQALKMTGLDGYLYARPHDGAQRGGDVYYVSSCASGKITRVLLADVAGHGSRVAEIAEQLRSLMQRYVNFTYQPRFMSAMNRKFARIADAGRFATTLALSFYAPTRKLSLSNAGHPAPLWYRAKDRRWIVLGVDPDDADNPATADLPLGIEADTGYQQIDIDFMPGDLLLMYTDALIESRGPDGRQLGVRGLLQLVRTLDVREPGRIVPTLIDQLTQANARELDHDDLTVLLLEATGQKSEWKKVAMGPINVVRGLFRGSAVGV